MVSFLLYSGTLGAQGAKTELYDLIRAFLYDSTGYENVGDWSVGKPKRFPVAWSSDRVQMSNDTSINFYRRGTTSLTIRGKNITIAGKPVAWNVLLKGARMGYSSFSILSPPSKDLSPKLTLDSLFGRARHTAKLMKRCDTNAGFGYYYYSLKLPGKDLAFLKVSWLTANGATALRIDGFDSWSNYAAKLDCPGTK